MRMTEKVTIGCRIVEEDGLILSSTDELLDIAMQEGEQHLCLEFNYADTIFLRDYLNKVLEEEI